MQVDCIMFECEDLIPCANQVFVIRDKKRNYGNYQQFYAQLLSKISYMDTSINFEDNEDFLPNSIRLEDGKKLIEEIYSYLKVDVRNSKYDFFFEEHISNCFQIFNESMRIFLFFVTEKKYISIYWEARP